MRLALRLVGCLGVMGAFTGCQADLPVFADAVGGGIESCAGPYADILAEYTGAVTLEDGQHALGAPDSAYAALPVGAVLTVGFVALGGIRDHGDADQPLDDLTVAGVFGGDGQAAVHVAGSLGEDFVFIGNVSANDSALDIRGSADVLSAVHVRLTGLAGTPVIDAVQALNVVCP